MRLLLRSRKYQCLGNLLSPILKVSSSFFIALLQIALTCGLCWIKGWIPDIWITLPLWCPCSSIFILPYSVCPHYWISLFWDSRHSVVGLFSWGNVTSMFMFMCDSSCLRSSHYMIDVDETRGVYSDCLLTLSAGYNVSGTTVGQCCS